MFIWSFVNCDRAERCKKTFFMGGFFEFGAKTEGKRTFASLLRITLTITSQPHTQTHPHTHIHTHTHTHTHTHDTRRLYHVNF